MAVDERGPKPSWIASVKYWSTKFEISIGTPKERPKSMASRTSLAPSASLKPGSKFLVNTLVGNVRSVYESPVLLEMTS